MAFRFSIVNQLEGLLRIVAHRGHLTGTHIFKSIKQIKL